LLPFPLLFYAKTLIGKVDGLDVTHYIYCVRTALRQDITPLLLVVITFIVHHLNF